MIARQMLGAFEGLLDNLHLFAGSDAINPHPQPYDDANEDRAGGGFLSPGAIPPDPGKASITAVIDDAIPFANSLFRLPGGASRVAAFWLQDGPRDRAWPGYGNDLPFGTEWRGPAIEDISRDGDEMAYRKSGALDFACPGIHRYGFRASHGAAVAGLAAGFAHDQRGADENLLIGVSLPSEVVGDTLGTFAEFYITVAILFVIHRARRLCRFIERRKGLPVNSVRLPVVINISFGLTAGPCDAGVNLARFMDAISASRCADLGPVSCVMASGNHRQSQLHAVLQPGQDLRWQIMPDDSTPSPVELWGPKLAVKPDRPARVAIRPAGFADFIETHLQNYDGWQQLCGPNGEIARVYPRLHAVGGEWRQGLVVITQPSLPVAVGRSWAPPGQWVLRVIDDGAPWEARVQRDDRLVGFRGGGQQSVFTDPDYARYDKAGRPIEFDPEPPVSVIRRADTLNALAWGNRQIRAGSVFADTSHLSPYCGLLNTWRGGDVLATTDRSYVRRGITVPASASGSVALMSGTSMAAPQVARWLAHHLAQGAAVPTRAELQAMPPLPWRREFPDY